MWNQIIRNLSFQLFTMLRSQPKRSHVSLAFRSVLLLILSKSSLDPTPSFWGNLAISLPFLNKIKVGRSKLAGDREILSSPDTSEYFSRSIFPKWTFEEEYLFFFFFSKKFFFFLKKKDYVTEISIDTFISLLPTLMMFVRSWIQNSCLGHST